MYALSEIIQVCGETPLEHLEDETSAEKITTTQYSPDWLER
jgi:hypothetical protein